MDKILEYINQKTNDKYISYIFESGIYNKNVTTIQLLFKHPKNVEISDNIKELQLLCKQYLANLNLNVEVVLNDYTLNFASLKNICYEITKKVLSNNVINERDFDVKFVNNKTILVINFSNSMYDNLIEQYRQNLTEEVKDKLNLDVEIQFQFAENNATSVIQNRVTKIEEDNMILETQQNKEYVKLKNIKNIYGEVKDDVALLAGNFDGNVNVSVAGTLQNFSIRETKPKNEQDDDKEKKSSSRRYLSFNLTSDDKDVKCILFLPKEQEIFEIENGKNYVVSGSVNSFNDMVSIRVKSIAECEIIAPKVAWRSCPKEYSFVKPEKFVQQEQVGLFFVDEMTKNQYLLDNTFVVYDLETTGINLSYDKIIDIGAFKIVNGKIVDKFSTFVNPDMPIPPEASKVNRITDDMVANYPNIDKILPDFYKFCYGSIIVGYNNIGFDDVFINREGKRLKYNFDNVRNDAFALAKANLPGLKNYKLGTVCANQNVPLIDAHRATNDALATAKLFIKLAEKFC